MIGSPRLREWLRRHGLITAIVVAAIALSLVNQRPGHDWGDDFALYIDQARSLTDGSVGEVAEATRYMLEESGHHEFSPALYPWGTPMLLAPIVAVFGIDYFMLKLVGVAAFAVFLLAYRALLAPRVGKAASLLLTALFAASASYIGWTDTVLSDLPFLCFAFVTLWWIDRCTTRQAWGGGSRAPLLWLGLLVGFTFSIRREGLALTAAVVAVQLLSLQRGSAIPWRRLALPHLVALGLVAALQLALPAPLTGDYEGFGPVQIIDNAGWYGEVFAEHVGLKPLGEADLSLFGSRAAAFVLAALFGGAAVLGLVQRVAGHARQDVPLLAFLITLIAVVLMLPFHEGRYLFPITPLVAYFAYQGFASTAAALSRPESRTALWGRAGGALLVAVLIAGNGHLTYLRTDYRLEYDNVHWGPEDPASREMFAAVREHTRRDDVLVFFRARAMHLYTERRTIQFPALDRILTHADWYVMEKGSNYSQILLSDAAAAAAGLTRQWENDRFVLWRIP